MMAWKMKASVFWLVLYNTISMQSISNILFSQFISIKYGRIKMGCMALYI